jgi:hypothetical protein
MPQIIGNAAKAQIRLLTDFIASHLHPAKNSPRLLPQVLPIDIAPTRCGNPPQMTGQSAHCVPKRQEKQTPAMFVPKKDTGVNTAPRRIAERNRCGSNRCHASKSRDHPSPKGPETLAIGLGAHGTQASARAAGPAQWRSKEMQSQ